jgi:Mg2+-importing ATPase
MRTSASVAAPGGERFWAAGPAEALAAQQVTLQGLTATEAETRRTVSGANRVTAARRRSLGAKVVRRLAEPLVAMLLVAAAVSAATGDIAGFAIITSIVLVSIGLDVVQEHRAEDAVEALRQSVAIRTTVRRDGSETELPVEALVPGDIVHLRGGDLVPADGVVLESRAAHADESLLTGEPYPVEKRPGACDSATPAEAFSALFGGTALVSGEALMLVMETGSRTRFGGIAAALEMTQPPGAFERGVHALGLLILRLTLFLVLFVLLAHLVFARPPLESFLFAIALAVGLTPELLPMVMTVTLSRGALRLAARKVVVKRLAAIHDLGAMDVLCTDKTGTLTEARIGLVAHAGIDCEDSARVLELAAVNSRFETSVRTPLDAAILDRAGPVGLAGWRRIDDAPFDFERRRVGVLAERDGQRLLVVKGAPESVLACCVAAERADGTVEPLDDALRQRLAAYEAARIGAGERLLAVAVRAVVPTQAEISPADEHDLVFAGFLAFVDPPKPSAAAAVARLAGLGVRVKLVSGDAPAVVRHLVDSLGLSARGMLTGAEIDALSDVALGVRVEGTDLFARVSPDQKTRIIRALRARGHVTGFIGDGINDAPAIRSADVGLSVDGAADVARAAADMIMLESDLSVLGGGVVEGRRTYANIMKYVRMGGSSNFGNMLSMALASLVTPFLPLTPIQILLNNLLYDLSELGIPFDSVDADEVAAPHAWSMSDILRFMLALGPVSSLFDAATFAVLRLVFDAGPDLFRTAWFVESITTQVLVIFLIRTSGNPWRSRPHPILTATSLGALSLALALALGPLDWVFGFVPLPAAVLGAITGLVVLYLVAVQLARRHLLPLLLRWPPRRQIGIGP